MGGNETSWLGRVLRLYAWRQRFDKTSVFESLTVLGYTNGQYPLVEHHFLG
ncbi:hypothetical protein NKDENANG_01141 [Candidatus Entotheonellaceae bacterium PAL068K]